MIDQCRADARIAVCPVHAQLAEHRDAGKMPPQVLFLGLRQSQVDVPDRSAAGTCQREETAAVSLADDLLGEE